ncbi:MAG: alkaline phosphatase family protein [Bacteroidetes bacterium]|nr:alkaline phosphatase family protein [Bacteroidota bacterium]
MGNKKLLLASALLSLAAASLFFFGSLHSNEQKSPKLVIGIVIDQMAYDYIPRYWNKYSENGFKKLVNEGFFCKNANYMHFPTYTAVGHTCIYTGSVPSINGICANDWVDSGKTFYRYCADDTNYHAVGCDSKEDRMAPTSLLVNTITDELRISSGMNSKVIGIALKDRGGIFPAGHKANASYWYEAKSKNWITSSYYMNSLPEWVNNFNKKDLPDKYLNTVWNTLLPINEYTESLPDDNNFEEKFKGEKRPVFPHDIPALKEKNPNILRYSPFGNTLTREFAEETIKSEKLGMNGYTDFLCVSFSSTDYVGHKFGPNSIEAEDTYLRMDLELADLLKYAEETLGRENVLVFLTADHGICSNPEYLKTQGVDAGTFYHKVVLDSVNAFLFREYGKDSLAMYFLNQQVFLNRGRVVSSGLPLDGVINKTADYIKQNVPGAEDVFTAAQIKYGMTQSEYGSFFLNGFYESRCGDVFVNFRKFWIEDRTKGAEHGSPYEYDTHVPLIWYGWKIKKGELNTPVKMVDVTPTLAALLGINPPEGCIGKPIKEITDFLK